jgi:hypothetical protein
MKSAAEMTESAAEMKSEVGTEIAVGTEGRR